MNQTLAAWNQMDSRQASAQLQHCCASTRWAESLAAMRPFVDEYALYQASDDVWGTMQESDWMEAFRAHPRIGQKKVQASEQSQSWSLQEQSTAGDAGTVIKQSMVEANLRYEEIFGFTYIVCATGKSLPVMLYLLEARLQNDRATELAEAAEQQRQITQLRLRKWLNP